MKKAKPLFFGRVNEGKVLWNDANSLALWLGLLEGQQIEATFDKLADIRTLPQNKYYWGYVLENISASSGHTKEELHEFCKAKFNRRPIEIKGKIYDVPHTTTDLEVGEFQDYIERIKSWAAQELEIQFIDDIDL